MKTNSKTRTIAAALIIIICFSVLGWYLFSDLLKKPQEMPWKAETFGTLIGTTKSPVENPKSVVVLMHGFGSDEEDLKDLGSALSPESAVVSLRAPILLTPDVSPRAYAWFHNQSNPPHYNFEEVKTNFDQIQQAILAASDRYHVPLNKFMVMGFSQGAIMTIGLALSGTSDYGAYIAFSGRTLQEFIPSKNAPILSKRPLLILHGTQDKRIPFAEAEKTQEILKSLHANFEFKSFEGDHTILPQEVAVAKTWLKSFTTLKPSSQIWFSK